MSDIDLVQLRRLDVTQLLVFAELMRHRKLTLVADRLGLTQSAISHALKRLRQTFADELFLRRPAGVEPTARAEALEPLVLDILRLATRALTIERSFDPATAERVVRIGAPDYEAALFAAPLVERLGREAPGIRPVFRAASGPEAADRLAAGEIDLALGFLRGTPEGIAVAPLFPEAYAVIARRGHPALAGGLTLDAYCAARHLLVSPGGDLSGIVDAGLADLGRARRVVAATPLFFPALATVARTDLLATVPRRLALRFAPTFGLDLADPPLAVRPFTVSLAYHRRTAADLALAFVRRTISDLAADMA